MKIVTKEKLLLVFVIVVIVAVCLGGFYLVRKINYVVAYKSMVEQTVREMVKDECLKRGEK